MVAVLMGVYRLSKRAVPELMRDVFGSEAGVAARSAMGVASLPAGWAVEIEAVFELEASR